MSNIIVITAPSAAGKTTLIKKYISLHKNAVFSVSHTTRPKRKGEVDGKDYHFIDEKTFNDMINNSEFIEWALVHGNLYGTSFLELKKAEDDNIILILDIDVQGALFLKSKGIDAIYIFIIPPSIEDLEERLKKRGTENDESMKKRIWDAKRELEYKKEFDFVIVNDNLDKAYDELETNINSKLK